MATLLGALRAAPLAPSARFYLAAPAGPPSPSIERSRRSAGSSTRSWSGSRTGSCSATPTITTPTSRSSTATFPVQAGRAAAAPLRESGVLLLARPCVGSGSGRGAPARRSPAAAPEAHRRRLRRDAARQRRGNPAGARSRRARRAAPRAIRCPGPHADRGSAGRGAPARIEHMGNGGTPRSPEA